MSLMAEEQVDTMLVLFLSGGLELGLLYWWRQGPPQLQQFGEEEGTLGGAGPNDQAYSLDGEYDASYGHVTALITYDEYIFQNK